MADFKVNGKVFEVDENDIKEYMREEQMDRTMAIRCYFEDMGLVATGGKTEITEIEAPKAKRRYVKSGNPRKPTTKERKVDTEKKEILEKLMGVVSNITAVKNESEFTFDLGANTYTVKLIRQNKNLKAKREKEKGGGC